MCPKVVVGIIKMRFLPFATVVTGALRVLKVCVCVCACVCVCVCVCVCLGGGGGGDSCFS